MELPFQHCCEAPLPPFCKQRIEFQSHLPKATQEFCTGARTETSFLESSSKASFLLYSLVRDTKAISISIFSVGLSYFLTRDLTRCQSEVLFWGKRQCFQTRDWDLICCLALSLAVSKHSPCRKKECSSLHNLQ